MEKVLSVWIKHISIVLIAGKTLNKKKNIVHDPRTCSFNVSAVVPRRKDESWFVAGPLGQCCSILSPLLCYVFAESTVVL